MKYITILIVFFSFTSSYSQISPIVQNHGKVNEYIYKDEFYTFKQLRFIFINQAPLLLDQYDELMKKSKDNVYVGLGSIILLTTGVILTSSPDLTGECGLCLNFDKFFGALFLLGGSTLGTAGLIKISAIRNKRNELIWDYNTANYSHNIKRPAQEDTYVGFSSSGSGIGITIIF